MARKPTESEPIALETAHDPQTASPADSSLVAIAGGFVAPPTASAPHAETGAVGTAAPGGAAQADDPPALTPEIAAARVTETEAAVARAQADVLFALAHGADRSITRRVLADAETAFDEARSTAIEVTAADAGATADAVAAAVSDLVRAAEAELAALDCGEPHLPMGTAKHLALTRRAWAAYHQAAAAHRAKLAAMRDRLDGMDTQRREIVARRSHGQTDPNDGPMLALLDADIIGLGGLLATAEATAPVPPAEALERAENRWQSSVRAERIWLLTLRAVAYRRLADEALEALEAAGGHLPRSGTSKPGLNLKQVLMGWG